MEHDISDIIANLVRETGRDFEHQMEQQEQSLRRVSCIDPLYGRWVDVGIDFLFSALELEDRDFAARLPALADLTKSQRQQFLKRMQEHLHACGHCTLKHDYERDMNARIEAVVKEHSGYLLEKLREGRLMREN